MPMTLELLARLIGAQRAAISIVARAAEGRGHIGITKAQALQATACECYRTVRARHGQWLKAAR